MRPAAIFAFMIGAVALVTGIAYWSEEREASEALLDFARAQTTLASSIADAMRMNESGDAVPFPEGVLRIGRAIEEPSELRILLATGATAGLIASDGSQVQVPALEAAARSGARWLRLTRAEAASLGLPARTAVAGIRRIATATGPLSVVVVATAQAERDRELRGRFRMLISLAIVSAVVLGFGGFAMRKERKRMELAHALALTTLQTERDERLVRADKLATMGALATGIAHEVSTPLGVILGRAEQLLPKQTDERSRRSVETIAAQTERIHDVIRGLLALARGSPALLDHCQPDALARAAVELVEHRFEKAGVSLDMALAPELPRVSCDPRLFEQVLVNLLLNACDACEGGGHVKLEVSAEAGRIHFVVEDDGVGISSEIAARATEPFFTTKPVGKGSGLGLAIANEIVKHHCGNLSLAPRAQGHGTRAAVELPAFIGNS